MSTILGPQRPLFSRPKRCSMSLQCSRSAWGASVVSICAAPLTNQSWSSFPHGCVVYHDERRTSEQLPSASLIAVRRDGTCPITSPAAPCGRIGPYRANGRGTARGRRANRLPITWRAAARLRRVGMAVGEALARRRNVPCDDLLGHRPRRTSIGRSDEVRPPGRAT